MKIHNRASQLAALLFGVCLVATGAVPSIAAITSHVQVSATQARISVQQIALPVESAAIQEIVAVGDGVATAQGVLASSLGRTDTDSTRTHLARIVSTAAAAISRAVVALGRVPVESDKSEIAATRSEGAASLPALVGAVGDLSAMTSRLTAAERAVNSSIAERTLHLQQIAAAAQAASASYYHETVWASGFQTQIDACRGAVNLSANYHVNVIGEEWQCGGSRFPRAGALVQLTGIMSGLYRVGPVVAVLNAYVDHTSDIPRGYDLLYQTCLNGDAHTETFTELSPVN